MFTMPILNDRPTIKWTPINLDKKLYKKEFPDF